MLYRQNPMPAEVPKHKNADKTLGCLKKKNGGRQVPKPAEVPLQTCAQTWTLIRKLSTQHAPEATESPAEIPTKVFFGPPSSSRA